MALDDLQLVRRARRGEEEAFKILMERYQRKVFSIAFGIVHHPEIAMDISQEAFLKVYRYLDGFQGNSSFYTWLYRIVVNLCIDHLRKDSHADPLEYDDGVKREEVEGIEAGPVRIEDPYRSLDRREMGTHIGQALEKMTENHRTIIVLREIEGMSYEEIARTLRINKGTVMSRLHHARRNLRLTLLGLMQERGEDISEEAEQAMKDERLAGASEA